MSSPLTASDISPSAIEYPPDMTLVRRMPISRLDAGDALPLDWLMSGEAAEGGPAELLDGFIARLVAAGLPIFRATLHMSTLHPQLIGFTANWRSDLGFCDEVQVNAHVRETADYLTSPLRPVLERREAVRVDPRDPAVAALYPVLRSLAAAGATDYWAFPLPTHDSRYDMMTLATRAPEGISPANAAAIEALLPAFTLNVRVVSRSRVAQNVLDAYLGHRSGRKVLAGDISRGSGETIDAIVWISDMRNFTGLSDRLAGPDMVRLLNAYFEGLVVAVRDRGGEVLKFIGDGLLAIFPIADGQSQQAAAQAALEAGRDALLSIARLNEEALDLADIDASWRPLDMGIALHRGPVFFGNIGSRDRLDFTVIGPAVNLAARVQPLTKEVARRLLLTREVCDLISEPMSPLGDFSFRGLAHPVAVYAASEAMAA